LFVSLMLLIVTGLVAPVVGVLLGWYAWGRGGAAVTAAAGTSATGERKSWLDYGNFFIVALGILVTAIAFLVALYLVITLQPDTGLITDSNEVLAFLTAFFGVVGTLVGAFFAVKTSSDQATGATNLAGSLAGADTTPPTIVGTEPVAGAQGVSPGASVNATFSKDMNQLTITGSTFILQERDSNIQVTGSPTYDPATKRATFKPGSQLKDQTYYKATITTGVRDTNGNALPMARAWEFRVG
jgi:Bacterial Ig-like domain